MRKSLLLMSLALLALSTAQAADTAHFESKKALVLKAIAERQQVLAQEQGCVQAATAASQLKQCLQNAKQARETMGAQLRQEAQTLKRH